MSDTPITLEYELTQEWADALARIGTTWRGEVRAYYCLAYAAILALGIVTFGMAGFALASVLDMSADNMRPITTIAAGIGLALVLAWTRRIARLSSPPVDGAYIVGARVRYDIDAKGVHLVYRDMDWRTGWGQVREIKTEAEALSIQTPFANFSMPIAELPIPLEIALTRMRAWRDAGEQT